MKFNSSAELEQLRVNVNGDGSTILKIIGIQDYLWEQVTALATPYYARYNVLTDKTIFTAVLLCLYSFLF
jgi:hypothetical protein